MSPGQTTAIVAALVILIFGVVLLIRTWSNKGTIASRTETRGFSASEGDTIQFSCPSGKSISVYRATAICGDMTNGMISNTGCDPDTVPDPSSPNIGHSLDMTSTVGQAVNGQPTGSYAVPSGLTVCASGSTCNNIMISGTYDCVPVS